MIGLFFDQPEIVWNEDDASGASIKLELNADGTDPITARARLVDACGGIWEAERIQETRDAANDEEWRKQRKQGLSHALLQVLTHYTGMEQPWGILTGIRPTKLFHDGLNQGLPNEATRRMLSDQYGVTEAKTRLLESIVERQIDAVPDLYRLNREVSVYIGIPFCPTKCAYCTFPAYDINGRQGSVHSFLGGLHYEMRTIGDWLKQHDIGITSIYFGGGTPTSITAEEMDRLYEELYRSFPHVDRVREITVEAGRPDTITPEKLAVLRRWEIDRISINPQSYTQATLDAIGRHHTVQDTVDKFWMAREAGMNNINMDLIIGLPGEGIAEFEHTLRQTEQLMPESLTVHTLSFKRASEMTRNREAYRVASRDEVVRMMGRARSWAEDHGYSPYYLYRQKNIIGNLENIGFARPGHESIYNIIMMEELQTVIGLGCGASSKWVHPETGVITRFANPKEPKAYNDNYTAYTEAKIKTLSELYGSVEGPPKDHTDRDRVLDFARQRVYNLS